MLYTAYPDIPQCHFSPNHIPFRLHVASNVVVLYTALILPCTTLLAWGCLELNPTYPIVSLPANFLPHPQIILISTKIPITQKSAQSQNIMVRFCSLHNVILGFLAKKNHKLCLSSVTEKNSFLRKTSIFSSLSLTLSHIEYFSLLASCTRLLTLDSHKLTVSSFSPMAVHLQDHIPCRIKVLGDGASERIWWN